MKEENRKLLEESERTGEFGYNVWAELSHEEWCSWDVDEEFRRAIQEKVLEKAEKNRMLDDYREWSLGVYDPEIKKAVRQCLTYQVVGMRSEKYLGKGYYQHNEVRELRTEELTEDILCCTSGGRKFEIALWTDWWSEMGIGVCRGNISVNEVKEFGEITAVPKEENASFEFFPSFEGATDNKFFSTNYTLLDPENKLYTRGERTGIKKDLFIEKNKTIDDKQSVLEDKTAKESQDILSKAVEENKIKKTELEQGDTELKRKQKFIKVIHAAQKESLELDEALLNTAKNEKEI